MVFTRPKKVIFYEKPGCAGNGRQKELLKKHGVSFEVRSMISNKWDKPTLEAFFEGLSKEEIYNPFATKIKEGKFDPNAYTKEELIEQMLKEPLLIKRPLIEVDDVKLCGFDIAKLNALLEIDMPVPKDINACLSSDKCEEHNR